MKKRIVEYWFVLLLLFFLGADVSENTNSIANSLMPDAFPMCSGEIPPGRCTGSVYCSACKNCKYCAYCNSGGRCGVCGKRSRVMSRTPKAKRGNTVQSSTSKKTNQYTAKPGVSKVEVVKVPPASAAKIYLVTQSTSLREHGQAQAKVLKRLRAGDEVSVIETSGEFWWQVVLNGRKGWIKKHLLKEKKVRIYP